SEMPGEIRERKDDEVGIEGERLSRGGIYRVELQPLILDLMIGHLVFFNHTNCWSRGGRNACELISLHTVRLATTVLTYHAQWIEAIVRRARERSYLLSDVILHRPHPAG